MVTLWATTLATALALGLGASCDDKDKGPTGPQSYTETAAGMDLELIAIEAGELTMGSPADDPVGYYDERPAHRVTLRPYYLGRYEVTQRQWEIVMGTSPAAHQGCPTCPVENVSFVQVQSFLDRLNTLSGKVYRLPTEAEWEHACRAGSTTRYHFGDQQTDLSQYGWTAENAGGSTHPVGELAPNAWGLHDMYGNVEEWVQDAYGETFYAVSPTDNPVNDAPVSPANPLKVNRGGGFRDPAWLPRSAHRMWNAPDYRFGGLGFRIARSAQ